MTNNQIKLKYDEFFGTGMWEKDYKPHITVFAEQCVRKAISSDGFTSFRVEEPPCDVPLLLKTHSGKIRFGLYLGGNEFKVNRDSHSLEFISVSSSTAKEWKVLNQNPND